MIKLSNLLDLELFGRELSHLPEPVQTVIRKRLQIMEEAYGSPYLVTGYGWMAMYVLNTGDQYEQECLRKILRFYNIDSEEYGFEYSQDIEGNYLPGQSAYTETLYLLANGEISILIIRGDNNG